MEDTLSEMPARRPIKSRNTKWAEAITNTLVRAGISPNGISLIGMLAAILAGLSFSLTDLASLSIERILWMGGSILCQIRLLCNLFDGMVAIARNEASKKGELYNEVPDRISDAAIMIGLGYSLGGSVALGFLAALVSVFVAYVRAMGVSIGAPNDFCGPMAKPQRMAIVTILGVYMGMTPESWRIEWGESTIALLFVILGGVITAIRRLCRIAKAVDAKAV